MKTEITLTPQQIEEILREHLSKNFKSVGKIKLQAGRELRGHFTSENYEIVFKGAKCEVEIQFSNE